MAKFTPPGALENPEAAAKMPWLYKNDIVKDPTRIDISKPNAWQNYADNSSGTGQIPTFQETNALDQFEFTGGSVAVNTAFQVKQPAVLATPTAVYTGTAGAVTRIYKVIGRAGNLQCPAAASVSVASGHATLSEAKYITITWVPVPGYTWYDIYRTSAGGGSPSSTGLIGTQEAGFQSANVTTPTMTFVDNGIVADGSTAPTVNTTGGYVGDINVYGNINVIALSTPAAPKVTSVGTAGTGTAGYKIAARCGTVLVPSGHTAASSETQLATSIATLSATNYNHVEWQPVVGAVTYDIYRTTATLTSPTSTGLIGNTVNRYFNDTGIAGDSASAPATNTTGLGTDLDSTTPALASVLDISGNPAIAFTATGSAVNGLTETNAAAGGTVILETSGASTNVPLTIRTKGASALTLAPVGATGTVVIGGTAQTGQITLGSSSGTETVVIGNGAGISRVDIAHATIAGATVNIAGAAAAAGINDVVNIATGNTAGSGTKTVHIADGTPAGTGVNTVVIGAVNNLANTTTIQGGNGATAIALTPQTTGVVTVGASAGTGDVVLGSSSAAQSVKVADGAGAPTVTVANTSTAGATVTIAGANTANGAADVVNIATGATAGSGTKTVHIADGNTGGTGVTTVTIGSNANVANVTTIKGGSGATAINLTPQTTGVIVLGATAGTGDITVGTSSAAQSVKIAGGAGAPTVAIANVSTAGATVTVAGAATAGAASDVINIATGNAATTATKLVNIATGVPNTTGANQVHIGGGAKSAITLHGVLTSYTATNIVTAGGSSNAITGALLDANGGTVTVAAGLRVLVACGSYTLQAGANTFNLNSHGTDSIKQSTTPTHDLVTAIAANGYIDLLFNGTSWLAMGQ